MTDITPSRPSPSAALEREASGRTRDDLNSPRIAHTLTACCRCRTRKTRCDVGLPRCGPCERTNSHCEYFDQAKGTRIPRNYVVHLQHKVRSLERQLAALEKEDLDPDPEDMVRPGAAVKIQEHDETKYLGPSSGIAITRLVMQLAKEFTDAKSISDIVTQNEADTIKETFNAEGDKPTSKVYPLISDVAAEELPQRDLTNLLVDLFNCKLLAMYPLLHEATLAQDVEDVYNGSQDAFQNFAVRMVIAYSLQRMDTQYAGLADSYYLAALRYLEDAVKPMNIKTIQSFCLIGSYSLLTPTRTAAFFVVGLAMRLCQALGLCEEKTITLGPRGRMANPLDIDMRRRVAWCTMTMEFGLAHSIGRPSSLATSQEHLDVRFYEMVDDKYITKEGIVPGAPPSLKKWISIHFMKMRLLQLEIRRKLYLKKRPTPKDDQDPWFQYMVTKMTEWRDMTPHTDADSGLDKGWFLTRYNTMVVFLYRPSPQVPRPSVNAAKKCFAACKYNIYIQRDQVGAKSAELSWVFTQSVFMAINTILWTLSYYEVRQENPKEEVYDHLKVAMYCIEKSIERWPGVASAHRLYGSLINACLRIYEKDGDIPIAAGSPESTMDSARSRTTSPLAVSPPPANQAAQPPVGEATTAFGYFVQGQTAPFRADSFSPPAQRDAAISTAQPSNAVQIPHTNGMSSPSNHHTPSEETERTDSSTSYGGMSSVSFESQSFGGHSQFPLPSTFQDLNVSWNPSFNLSSGQGNPSIPALSPFDQPLFGTADVLNSNNVQYSDFVYPPSWNLDSSRGAGLTQQEQSELMHTLQEEGPSQINPMIQASNALFYPQGRSF